VRQELDKLLRDTLRTLADREGRAELAELDPELTRTRDARHGDFTSNVAMRGAKALGGPPRALAEALVELLPPSDDVADVEIAGPGFINFRLAPRAYHDELMRILGAGQAYGRSTVGRGRRVLVEYVSANPTGPLHVGHGRGAAYGATLANLLRATGHEVEEEYYINDAGRQMDILALSVWLRYAERLGHALGFPPNAYQGDYVRGIAASLVDAHGDALLGDITAFGVAETDDDEARLDAQIAAAKRAAGEQGFAAVFAAALGSVLDDIKDDLAGFGVRHGRWFSERSLADAGAVDAALATLQANDVLYERDGATWFRTTDFGDDKDRVVERENGARTYFASDIAYHYEKCQRGYDLLLNVLGSDHHGYVPRLRASIAALGSSPERLEAQLVQFVVLYRGEVKAQMSTRSGEYVTLRELREEVGNDAARFFYVSRSNDQHLEFDLELAKSRSNDNPVYYVQYAHARVASMLARLGEEAGGLADPRDADLAALAEPEEAALMTALSRFPEVVELAAANRAPQQVVQYLRDLAATFHSYYNAHRILVDEPRVRDARVALATAVQQVVRNGLALLDVSAPDSM
jgi:arginyl-tRNA synthetase